MSEGKRFGRYDLLEPIAKGGMAEVFMARSREDVGFERIVAVKRILPHLAADEEFISMFVDEAKIAVQLNHASIAQIYDLGMADDHYYIALEYIHGRDLRAVTNAEGGRGGAVPIDIACFIIMKVAEALDYAHRAEGRDGQPLNVIHRDVSPQNVIVSFEGDVKVIDFGLAKAAGRATQTQVGVLKGKLAYLSPEQARGETIDWRSDIFALGILLFELLTGQRLFLKDNDVDTVMAVRAGAVPDPRSIASDVSDALAAIVLKALASDRNARYQRAQELGDELEAYLYSSGQPLSRRKVGEYMVELFPEDFLDEGEVSDLLGMELLEEDLEEEIEGDAEARVHDRSDSSEAMELEPDGEEDLFDVENEQDRTSLYMADDDLDDATGPSPNAPELMAERETARSSLPSAPDPEVITTFEVEPETATATDFQDPGSRRRQSSSGVQAASSEHVTVEARFDDQDQTTSVGAEPLEPISLDPSEPDDSDDPGAHEIQTVVAQVPDRDTIPAPAPDSPAVTVEQMLSSAVQSLGDFPMFDDDEDDEGSGTVVTAFSDDPTAPIDSDPEGSTDAARGGSGRRRG